MFYFGQTVGLLKDYLARTSCKKNIAICFSVNNFFNFIAIFCDATALRTPNKTLRQALKPWPNRFLHIEAVNYDRK